MNLLEIISGWHWLALAVAMLPVQAATMRALISIVVGALAVALVMSVKPVPAQTQLWLFVGVTAVVCCIYWLFLRPRPPKNATERLQKRKSQLVGMRASLLAPISSGKGKVQIQDALWTVTSGQDLPRGTVVEVSGYDQNMLHVSKVAGERK